MPSYTSNLNLYKPSRNDLLALDISLSDNFSAIDTKLGSGLTDENGVTYSTLKERLAQLESKGNATKHVVIATDHPQVVADGTNDDTAGIQELLDLAIQYGGVKIIFPAGNYVVAGNLRMVANTHLDCAEGAVFTKKHNGGMLFNFQQSDAFSGYNGNGNIYIKGGVWDNNFPNYTGGTSMAFCHAENLVFEDVTFLNTSGGHAVEINGIKNCYFHRCKFLGFDDEGGTRSYSEAIQIDLQRGDGVFPWGGTSDDGTTCEDIWVDKCTFGASDTLGPWGRAVGSHSALYDHWHERITITRCTVNNCLHWAFRAYSWRDVHIADNKIYDCGGGISIDPNAVDGTDDQDLSGTPQGTSNLIERITITGNLIEGGGSYGSGMSIGGDSHHFMLDVVVTGNQINNYSGGYAMYLSRISESIITGNLFNNIELAVKMSDTWMLTFSGNLIRSANQSGIEAFTPNEFLTISGNGFFFCRAHGIWCSGHDTTTIDGNTFGGIGYTANGSDFQGIRVTSGCDRMTITGNTFRQWGSTYAMNNAIYTSSSVTNMLVATNNASGIGMLLNGDVQSYGNRV